LKPFNLFPTEGGFLIPKNYSLYFVFSLTLITPTLHSTELKINSNEALSLLELTEEQAESVVSMDALVETDVYNGDKVINTARMRMVYDKSKGAMLAQALDNNGNITSQILSKGTRVWSRGRRKGWTEMPMDAQTKETLENMGVDFNGGQGMAGGELVEAPGEDAIVSGAYSNTPEFQDPSVGAGPRARPAFRILKGKHWSKEKIQRVKNRIQGRIDKSREKKEFARARELDDPGKKRKGLVSRFKKGIKNKPWEEETLLVDEETGLVVERRQWVKAKKWPGGKRKISRAVNVRKGRSQTGPLATPDQNIGDDDLVEIGHLKVTKVKKMNGAAVPEETEAVNYTTAGKVRMKMRWGDVKVNEGVDERVFERE
jgi:hypothetical protein